MKSSKRLLLSLALPLALFSLAACETGYGYGGASYSEGYYDNYYGPVRHGYWNDDGYFYYRTQRDRSYVRDDSHHFRRDFQDGARHFRVRGDGPRHPERH